MRAKQSILVSIYGVRLTYKHHLTQQEVKQMLYWEK